MQYENCATALDYFATRSPAACNHSSIFWRAWSNSTQRETILWLLSNPDNYRGGNQLHQQMGRELAVHFANLLRLNNRLRACRQEDVFESGLLALVLGERAVFVEATLPIGNFRFRLSRPFPAIFRLELDTGSLKTQEGKMDVVFPGIVYEKEEAETAMKQFYDQKVDFVIAEFLSWSEDFAWIRFLRDMPQVPIIFTNVAKDHVSFKDTLDEKIFFLVLSKNSKCTKIYNSKSKSVILKLKNYFKNKLIMTTTKNNTTPTQKYIKE
jgi:hypothetical protein